MENSLTKISIQDIQNVFKKKGYTFFEQGSYNLNIIGIRNLDSGNKQDNTFNDLIIYCYKDKKGNWIKEVCAATTDPGLSGLLKPENKKGTAILVPNQYKGVYQLDLHHNKYLALCQRGYLQVYRDNNKNAFLDFNNIEEGNNFGINIHKAGADSTYVNNWSLGCQVFKKEKDFNKFIEVCKKAQELYGKKFTYTLLTSKDF